MSSIRIQDFDPEDHPNPMRYVDDAQRIRYERSGGLAPYKVCAIDVCGFRFFFHSVMQLELCIEYYSKSIQPCGRLPVYRENYGGDHWETQRWFEQLPLYLFEKSKRPKVVTALERGLIEYLQAPGAITETKKPNLYSWSGT